MNKRSSLPTIHFARIRFLIFTLCALCVLCGKSSAQNFKTVHDGVEYAQVDHKIGGDPVKINLLRLDLKKVRLDVHHAMDAAIGTEKTSSIAARHGAVAAINSGFFRLDNSIFAGDNAGALQIDRRVYSESLNGRVLLFINNLPTQTDVSIARMNLNYSMWIGKREFIVGANRARGENDLLVFTPDFARSTLTNSGGMEFIVKGRKVRAIANEGSNPIPPDGFVVSASGSQLDSVRDLIKIGTRIELLSRFSSSGKAEFLKDGNIYEDIVSGVPQLIKNGKIDITWEQEKSSKAFVETRHPRTAVAKLKDGKFLMITVDGRQPGVSVGMNLHELADYLLSLGAVDAMNLDGGGSTTMFLDGKVVNKPSDKGGERKVSDAILVTLRKGNSKRN